MPLPEPHSQAHWSEIFRKVQIRSSGKNKNEQNISSNSHASALVHSIWWINRRFFLILNFSTLFYPKWSSVHTAMVVILIGKILSVSLIKSWGGWKTLFHLVGGSKPTGCDWTKTPVLHVNDGEKCGVILIESTNPLLFLRLKVKALLEKKN